MSDTESNAEDVFDVDRIGRLVELMERHDLSEVNLKQGSQKIRLRRGAAAPPAYPAAYPAGSLAPLPAGPVPAAAVPATPPPAAQALPDASAATGEAAADPPHIKVITSPMVGTFYARPNPNADPFVQLGDLVDKDTTICIIEAMKVFNEIPAEIRGKVVAILADDEEPVDHGRPLFKVDTSAG